MRPKSAKTAMSRPAVAAAWTAAQRRWAGVRPAVSATNIGTVPSGSTITKRVTTVSENASQFMDGSLGGIPTELWPPDGGQAAPLILVALDRRERRASGLLMLR